MKRRSFLKGLMAAPLVAVVPLAVAKPWYDEINGIPEGWEIPEMDGNLIASAPALLDRVKANRLITREALSILYEKLEETGPLTVRRPISYV